LTTHHVAEWSTNTDEVTLLNVVDGDALHNGVRVCDGREESEEGCSKELHCAGSEWGAGIESKLDLPLVFIIEDILLLMSLASREATARTLSPKPQVGAACCPSIESILLADKVSLT
jgi:hypothetical protein